MPSAPTSPDPSALFDGRGMYLEIAPSGGCWWRFKYRFAGKEKRISLGVYPEVGIKEARERRDDVRKQVAANIDPGAQRKAEAIALVENKQNTFKAVAEEWIRLNSNKWSAANTYKITRLFERDIFPWIGDANVNGIQAQELLRVCRRIEGRNANETTHRALQNCGRVFRYAVATGRADRDPSLDLTGALAPVVSSHHASITEPQRFGKLLNDFDGYSGGLVARCALRLAPLVFVRPGELRKAEWSEMDLDKAEWRIPAAKMKMKVLHIVPLSKQAVAVLRELQPYTQRPKHTFVFPSERTWMRPMSNNTVNAALRSLGYSHSEMTGHVFRSTGSTMLNERGWNRDAIERQLAHAERDSVQAAYNYAEHLPERRKMMQAWADYLDEGATVDLRCHLPIERQTKTVGATWLDQQLVKGSARLPNTDFGSGILQALQLREDFLVDQGLARRFGSRVVLAQNLLATLRDRELNEAAARITRHSRHAVDRSDAGPKQMPGLSQE